MRAQYLNIKNMYKYWLDTRKKMINTYKHSNATGPDSPIALPIKNCLPSGYDDPDNARAVFLFDFYRTAGSFDLCLDSSSFILADALFYG